MSDMATAPRAIIDLTKTETNAGAFSEGPHTKKRKAGSASYDLPPKATDAMHGPTGCVDFLFPVGLHDTDNLVLLWNQEIRKQLERQQAIEQVIVFVLFLIRKNVSFSLLTFADLVEHEHPRKVLAQLALRKQSIGKLHSVFFDMKLEDQDQAITDWLDMTDEQLQDSFWKLLTLQDSTFGFPRADLTKLLDSKILESKPHIKVVYNALMRLSPEDAGDDDDDQPPAEKRTKAQDHEAEIAVE